MGIKTSSLQDVGDIMLNEFGAYSKAILDDLFDNLMETTPENTGTLKYNWRFKPGLKVGNFLEHNDGTGKPEPRVPRDVIYSKAHSNYVIYNNSPYIVHVNNGESGNQHNQNFIQKALAMTNARF